MAVAMINPQPVFPYKRIGRRINGVRREVAALHYGALFRVTHSSLWIYEIHQQALEFHSVAVELRVGADGRQQRQSLLGRRDIGEIVHSAASECGAAATWSLDRL